MNATPSDTDYLAPGAALRVEEWSQHGEFVRRLARRLVDDEHVADDLAQDAQLAALTSSGRVPSSVREHRAWLARVLRNLSINWRRGQDRRAEHERASAKCAFVDPAQVSSRIELQRLMLAQVAKLAEPYRTTVYLRFYQQLKPRQIAERQQVSVHTVKTRLQRGLQHLRGAMDRDAGPRSSWCAALVPSLGGSNPIGTTTGAAVLGGAALHSKPVAALAAVVVVAISLGWFVLREQAHPDLQWKEPEPGADLEASSSPTRQRPVRSLTTTQMAVEKEARALTQAGDWIVSGRVTETDGTPIAGATVSAQLRPSSARVETTTDAQGRYTASLVIPDGVSHWAKLSIHASAVARNYRTGIRNLHGLRAADSNEHDLTVDFHLASGASVRGRILAANSTPEAPTTATRTKVALVDENGRKCASNRVNREGRFTFPLPDRKRIWVVAGRGRFGTLVKGPIEVVAGEDLDLGDLVLNRPSALRGLVSFPDGRPIRDLPVHARVVGEHTTHGIVLDRWHEKDDATTGIPPTIAGAASGSSRTDGNGHFSFYGLAPGTYELYVNSLDPESKDGPYQQSVGRFQTGEFAAVTLRVYRVRLTVVDADGLAVPHARAAVRRKGAGGMESLTTGLGASMSFDVGPGEYVASTSADGAGAAARAFTVEEGIYSYEIRLVLDFAPATGEIDLVVTDASGTRLRAFEVNLWHREEDTLSPAIIGKVPDADGVLRGIPVGRYRLRVRFAMEGKSSSDPPRPPSLGNHFAISTFAAVEPGKQTEVRAHTKAGGRLLVSIPTSSGRDESVPVSIELDDGRGGVRRLLYLTKSADGPSPSQQLGRPRTGAEGYTELIHPGIYTLRAVAKGFASFETRVRIVGGETTRARLLLRQQ